MNTKVLDLLHPASGLELEAAADRIRDGVVGQLGMRSKTNGVPEGGILIIEVSGWSVS
jgi:hypothetical protein